jgi:CheY-like chemotaxis protein
MGRKILVVDDEHLTVDMLSHFLTLSGYEPVGVYSSRQMWDRLAYDVPDAILLDIMLPDGDGVDLCRKLMTDPATQHIPIIMISARNPPATSESQAAGAKEYFNKPIDLKRLQQALQNLGLR